MNIKINMNFKVGKVVKFFVLSDLALLAGWGLVEPVVSIFIIEKIQGATLTTVGISAAAYWLLRSILQLPIANFLDRNKGENDDFRVLISGLLIAALSAFIFTIIEKPWQLYLNQIVHAFAFALYVPAWSGIFSRHLDKDRMAFDWSLDSTAIGLAMGVSGLVSGVIASWFGFNAIFILAAIFSMIAALILIMAPGLILPKKTSEEQQILKDHSSINIQV